MIFIDSHVHIYEPNTADFLTATARNFEANAKSFNATVLKYQVIILMDPIGLNTFTLLSKSNMLAAGWEVQRTKEENSLIAESSAYGKIVIIQGKQLVTKENLEVLAIGSSETRNYLSLENTIVEILRKGGIPVIPWGFGKWWGKRGRTLNDFITKTDSGCYFLGDNGGRPAFLSRPEQFDIAASKGIKILPGSDPLPIPDDYKRAATYGFILEDQLYEDYPAEHIKSLLFSLKSNPPFFGTLCKPGDFLRRQVLLRLNKRSIN